MPPGLRNEQGNNESHDKAPFSVFTANSLQCCHGVQHLREGLWHALVVVDACRVGCAKGCGVMTAYISGSQPSQR